MIGHVMWTVQPDHSNISERQLRAVIDTIPALVWLANTEGAAEYLNRRWLEYTGLTQTQAVGWGWTVALPAVGRWSPGSRRHPKRLFRFVLESRACEIRRR